MTVSIRSSFVKDSRKLNSAIKKELLSLINKLEITSNLLGFPNCKKLSGYKTVYRIRLHNYRIGMFYSNNSIELVRILDRKDVYPIFLKGMQIPVIDFAQSESIRKHSLAPASACAYNNISTIINEYHNFEKFS